MMFTVLLTFTVLQATPSAAFDFQPLDLGKVPSGWVSAKTGEGEGSVWKLVEDSSAPGGLALEQQAAGPKPFFNLCILEKSHFQDGELSVRVKARTGKIDQGGGLVWRYQDANNYYVARWNPLELNYRVYHVKDGKRTQLATKEEINLPADQWHTVTIRQEGDEIVCLLNGQEHLRVKDGTFKEAGKVGLWTKADAVTRFADFRQSASRKLQP